jgi:hypothetical protein
MLCFKHAESSIACFSVFGLVCSWLYLFFCRLSWSGLGELVLVMEQNPCYSIGKLYGECKSRFLETSGAELSKGWREVDKEQL